MNISLTPELEKYKIWLNQEIQIGIDQAAQGKLILGDKSAICHSREALLHGSKSLQKTPSLRGDA